MIKKLIIILIFYITCNAWSIAPPRHPDVRLPDKVLQQLKQNSALYMPATGLRPQMEQLAQQKQLYKLNRVNGYNRPFIQASIPVLCAQYADVRARWEPDSMQQQLFGNWPTGSMRQYYHDVSYGQFDLTGQVYGWFKLAAGSDQFTDSFDNVGDLLLELFRISDISVDFGQYDNDGPDGIPNSGDDDGFVDIVGIIHSGPGGEEGNGGIWSHSWEYRAYGDGPYVTDDVSARGGYIRINDYIIQPEISYDQMVEIGVFCHEFGHALGLPDLYDRDDSSEGVGNWCVMGSGSYGGDSRSPETPVHMCAWCKELLGWLDPVVVDEDLVAQTIPAIEDTAVAYKVWTRGKIDPYMFYSGLGANLNMGQEYFLLEYRRQQGFDANLMNSGLVIWHIDNTVKGWNDNEDRKLVDLEAADGKNDLDYLRNRADAGDVYPGTSMNRVFSRTSMPGSLNNDNKVSQVVVSNIGKPGETITADIEIYARDIALQSYDLDDSNGNSNGFLDPGESASLTVILENLGPKLNNITGVLSTDDPQISVTESLINTGPITDDGIVNNFEIEFLIHAQKSATHHPVQFLLTLDDGDGYVAQYDIPIMMDNRYILLVDDSFAELDFNSVPIVNYYKDALKTINVNYYDTWSTLVSGAPDETDLQPYATLIWFTGSNGDVFSVAERTVLSNYLDNGGNLLLCSQNAGYDLFETGNSFSNAFFSNYLHAGYIADSAMQDSLLIVNSSYNDPQLFQSLPWFYATGSNGANNNLSPDVITPLDSAIPLFYYQGTQLPDSCAGLQYNGDDYRLIYLAFAYEALADTLYGNFTRNDLMAYFLAFLQEYRPQTQTSVTEHMDARPDRFALFQNYPNPFNPQTTIHFELPKNGRTSLVVYNVMGQKVRTLVNSMITAGTHALVWDGLDDNGQQVASGVYFYRLSFDNFTQIRKMVLTR